jgi:phosphoglycerate kinase
MNKKTVSDLDVAGKRVLVRVDFNVPQDKNTGDITDDRRIRAAIPTIQHLVERGARVILMSHLGRPEGDSLAARIKPSLRLDPIAKRLWDVLNRPVRKLDDCVGAEVEAAVAAMRDGDVVLLENVRFHPEEESKDEAVRRPFAERLARLGDLYVNDAFGTAHRAHASTTDVALLLPSAAGFLMAKELEKLGGVLTDPPRPFYAILGGAKVKDKIKVIENLLPRVDILFLGGGMAYTFFKAQGKEIGHSLLDAGFVERAGELLKQCEAKGWRLELPCDIVITDNLDAPTRIETVATDQIPADMEGVDIGPETVRRYAALLHEAKTVIWNGPMGVFENRRFAKGTRDIAQALAEIAVGEPNVIIGGGDSAAAVEQMGFADRMDHVSTGGGASLEFLEGKELPGVAALSDR